MALTASFFRWAGQRGRDPTIDQASEGVEARQSEHNAQRPHPPDMSHQGAPSVQAAEFPTVGELQPHRRIQLCLRDAQPHGGAGRLERNPSESTALEDSSPALPLPHTQAAFRVEEDPASRLCSYIVCNFCMHRN